MMGPFFVIVQAFLAVLGLAVLARALISRRSEVSRSKSAETMRDDVLLPICLLLPLLAPARFAPPDLAVGGWTGFGAPILLGAVAVAFAAVLGWPAGQGGVMPPSLGIRWIAAATATGLVLLLLAAVDELTPFVGQSGVALAAILMWLNAPDFEHDAKDQPAKRNDNSPHRTGVGPVILIAIAQAAIVWTAGPAWAGLATAVAVVWAAGCIALLAVLSGPAASVRCGAWAAVYGPLFALSVVSMTVLLPNTFDTLRHGGGMEIVRIARGFSRFGMEAALLLLLPSMTHLISRLPADRLRHVGAVSCGILLGALAFRIMTQITPTGP